MRRESFHLCCLLSAGLFFAGVETSMALPAYTGGNGAISFGVAPYGGAPVVGGPTFIANNVTGRNDILSSPGLGSLGGYLTASPILANNIASYGGPLPGFGVQIGGSNGNGNFGSAAAKNTGTIMSYSITDSGAGGGTASYVVNTEVAIFTDITGSPIGTKFGAFLTMGGAVPLIGNAVVAGLRIHIDSATAGSPFLGGFDLPDMVLAISRNGAGNTIANYNVVTLGGVGGANAGLILDNGNTGLFRAMAVDNMVLGAAIPAGDALTVSATLTAYADPAYMDSFDGSQSLDLLALTGPLPDNILVGSDVVPEPSSLALFGLAALFSMQARRVRRSS